MPYQSKFAFFIVSFCLGFLLGLGCPGLYAQEDTLRLDLAKAEKMFLDSNYQLLAQKYNIESQKALILQARLYPNPNLSVARGPVIPLHDPLSNYPTSSFTNNAETQAQLSQVILLAGKRNKQIKIAQANEQLAEYQFFDLMRTLKYTLRSDFYNIYYLQRSAKVYDMEIKALEQIVTAFNQQQDKGYIAEKEVVRIKAQLYSFKSEYLGLMGQINAAESDLKLLLQTKANAYIVPQVDTAHVNHLNIDKYSLLAFLDSASHNRTDLLMARENTVINKLNYNYQRALAVPDLTLSLSYDHQGSYARDFNAAGVAMDLPFFNRNQGNIKSAKFMIDNTVALEKSVNIQVTENVNHALENALLQDKLAKSIDGRFEHDFDRLMHEVLQSYQKRNIGMLDFLDFYDAYKQNTLELNGVLYNRIQALEDINYNTATNFFN